MSKLSDLREALVQVEAAEEALAKVRKNYLGDHDRGSRTYHRIDDQFEVVGDAATIIRDVLRHEELMALGKQVSKEPAK